MSWYCFLIASSFDWSWRRRDNEICEGGEGAMEYTCLGMSGEGRIEYEGVA